MIQSDSFQFERALNMKWTWDKFGYILIDSSGSCRDTVRDRELILALLSITSMKDARVRFFPDLGRAVVTSREPATLTLTDRFRANRESHWDVEYYTESEWIALQRKADWELQRLDAIDDDAARTLIQNGIITLDDVAVLPPERIAELLNIDTQAADKIIERADAILALEAGD